MTSTKTHSTGQVAFARCTFWQLHQINLLSSLCVKSTSSLILAWKGCNYPLIMKTAVYQARQQGAKWTCWIWITPDVWLRPLSSPQCTHGCAWTDELPPLAWLLPFFHGDGFELTRHEPVTNSHKPLSCKGMSHQPALKWAAVSPGAFKATSHNCLSVSALASPPQAEMQTEPSLR